METRHLAALSGGGNGDAASCRVEWGGNAAGSRVSRGEKWENSCRPHGKLATLRVSLRRVAPTTRAICAALTPLRFRAAWRGGHVGKPLESMGRDPVRGKHGPLWSSAQY